jgi:hypothetical protein
VSLDARDSRSSRADVTSLLVIAAVALTMAAGPIDGRRLFGQSWIDRVSLLAAAHPDVNAIGLLIAVLVVCLGSTDNQLSITGTTALATGALNAALLAVGAAAETWTDISVHDFAWGVRLHFMGAPAAATVIAGIAAWLAFRGVIIGDGNAGSGDGRAGAGAPGGADLSRE